MSARTATVTRTTRETSIRLTLDLDGTGKATKVWSGSATFTILACDAANEPVAPTVRPAAAMTSTAAVFQLRSVSFLMRDALLPLGVSKVWMILA